MRFEVGGILSQIGNNSGGQNPGLFYLVAFFGTLVR